MDLRKANLTVNFIQPGQLNNLSRGIGDSDGTFEEISLMTMAAMLEYRVEIQGFTVSAVEEKGWLLAGGSYDVYNCRFDQLAEKYGIAPPEVPPER